MGTSFVEYHERGFWSWDGYLEHLLFLLAKEIGPSPAESWLSDLRDHWHLQSSGAFTACIHPELDEYVTSPERLKVILNLIEGLVSGGEVTEEVRRTAEFMRCLLLGELTTDASSPLDYMVSGAHPYEWWVLRNAEIEGT